MDVFSSRILSCVLLHCTLLFLTQMCQADLFVSDAGGTILMDGTQPMDTAVLHPMSSNFAGKFYGVDHANIYVSENGNLNFANQGDYPSVGFNDPFTPPASMIPRIAPFWDDVLMVPANDLISASQRPNYVIDHSVAGDYLGVTWKNMRLANETYAEGSFPDRQRSAQVLWFERDMVLRGISFEKDDILFSYQAEQPGPEPFGKINATIGVTLGNFPTPTFTTAPSGTSNGYYVAGNVISMLPWQDGTAMLFRPNLAGTSYSSSILTITAVPESAFWLGVTSTLLFIPRRWRSWFTARCPSR
jgi:hypothetical protein